MSAKQPKTVLAEAYLTIQPEWTPNTGYYSRDEEGHPILRGAKVTRVTQGRPSLQRGGVATKIKFRIDASLLLPLRPEVLIDLHAGNAEVIEVEAVHPGQEEDGNG
jgi:hypothetical protein